MNVFLVTARLISAFAAAGTAFYVVAHGPGFVPPQSVPFIFQMLGFGVMALGFVVGSLQPRRGGPLALAGLGVFSLVELLSAGSLPLGTSFWVFLACAAAVTFCAWQAGEQPDAEGHGMHPAH
ncbi:MAG: hypothetical protein R3F20_13260 [Planctomycetota bacterium]